MSEKEGRAMWHLLLTLLPGKLCTLLHARSSKGDHARDSSSNSAGAFLQLHAGSCNFYGVSTDSSCLHDRRGGYAEQCVVAALLS